MSIGDLGSDAHGEVLDDVEVGEDVKDVEEDIKDSVGGGLEEDVDGYEG